MLRLADRLHPETTTEPATNPTEAFVTALPYGDDARSMAMARAIQAGQTSRKTGYFGALSSAMRLLGQMWEGDRPSFLQMSMAAGRLFSIMRTIRREVAAAQAETGLGVTMAADLFREAGWQVDLRAGCSLDMFVEVTHANYVVIGLSAGHPTSVPALTSMVPALRQAALATRIILSGRVLDDLPGLGAICGVDAVTQDFDTLLATCNSYRPA